ncbi:MAG: hypothetical protein LBU77_04550 [Clostridiales bacterium]|jgi:flagellin|nr:hypothetical protein [Clostridiales bacterium]
MRINTNIAAFQTYTNLMGVSANTEKAMQRLSSGHKINSVKDNPAGMAISNKLRGQIRGLQTADKNALDAVSVIQTAESSLQEVHNMLHKMKELALQASNDTVTPEDRKRIQSELSLLIDEIDDNAQKVEYNGMKLLNGAAARLTEIAAADKNNIDCAFVSENVADGQLQYKIVSVGMPAEATSGTADVPPSLSGELSINGELIKFDPEDELSVNDSVEKLRELCDRNNIEVAIEDNGTWADYANGTKRIMLYTREAGSGESIEIEGDANVLAAFGLTQGTTKGTDAVVSGATLSGDPVNVTTDGNKIEFSGSNSRKIEMKLRMKDTPEADFTWKMKNGDTLYSNRDTSAEITPFGLFQFQIGTEQYMEMSVQIPAMTSDTLDVSTLNIATAQGAQKALDQIDAAVDKVSEVRARLGAYQNRLEYTSLSLTSASETTTLSLSRIRDTDMALEMTNMTQANVLTQAGIAILAQANQRPQQLLQLLN